MSDRCGRCHGYGWVLDENLDAAVCPDCDGIPTRRHNDLAKALGALTDAYRGNRSPAYAGASDYVPIAVIDALLGASS